MKRPVKHQHRCPECGHRLGYSMTPEDVRRARVLLGDGKTLTQVARIFGVTTQAIYRLKTGRTWRNIK